MSSGGGKTTTTTAQSGPPQWAIPYFQGAMNRANDLANQPYTPYTGPRIADFTPDQQQGFDMTRQQVGQGQYTANMADRHLNSLFQGAGAFVPYRNQYADQNPHLDQMVSDAQSDVTKAYQNSTLPGVLSQFNAGGAYGGTAMQQALSQSNQDLAGQLGRVSTNLRNADYDRRAQLEDSYLGRQQAAWAQNQSNMLQGVGALGSLNDARYADSRALQGIGALQQNLYQNALDTGYNDYLDERDWSANRMGLLSNALAAIQGGTTSQTGANPNYRSAGQNAAGAAAVAASLAKMWNDSGWGWGGV